MGMAGKRLLGEAGWVAFGTAASGIGTLVGVRLLTEFVPPGVFGEVALTLGIVTLSSSIFCMPRLHAVSRFYPVYVREEADRAPFRARVGGPLARNVAWLAVFILIGGAVARTWFVEISYLLFVGAACLLAAEVFRLFEMNLLNAARRQKPYALWEAAESWSRPALAVAAVIVLGGASENVLFGYLAATLGGLGVYRLFFTTRSHRGGSRELPPELDRELARYVLPLMPLAIVSWIHSMGDRYLLGALAGTDAVGLYAATYGLVQRSMAVVPNILMVTLRPVLFEAASAHREDEEGKALRLWIRSAVLILGLGTLVLLLAKDALVKLLLAESYRGAVDIIPILAVGFSFLFLSQIFNTISMARKESQHVLYSETGAALVAVGGGIPLISAYGIAGAAFATSLSYLVQLILAVYLARRGGV